MRVELRARRPTPPTGMSCPALTVDAACRRHAAAPARAHRRAGYAGRTTGPAGPSARTGSAARGRWSPGTPPVGDAAPTSVPALASTASLPDAYSGATDAMLGWKPYVLPCASNWRSCACVSATFDAAVRTVEYARVVGERDDHVVRVAAPEQEHAPRSPCIRWRPALPRCCTPQVPRLPARAPAVRAPVEVRNFRRDSIHD